MSKTLNIFYSDQARKTIRSIAGSRDESASDLIRDIIKEKLKDFSNLKDSINEK